MYHKPYQLKPVLAKDELSYHSLEACYRSLSPSLAAPGINRFTRILLEGRVVSLNNIQRGEGLPVQEGRHWRNMIRKHRQNVFQSVLSVANLLSINVSLVF